MCNYSTRQPETKCQLTFGDDLHVASFEKFHKEPIDGNIQGSNKLIHN